MSAVAAASQPAQQEDGGIPIESLPLEELAKVKKSLDQEQTALIKNFEQLKFAMNSYMRSKRAVEALSETEVGSETLIPLTNAMYVPARTSEVDSVLLNIGTGYYSEKPCKGAMEFFDRKSGFLKARAKELEILIRQKQNSAKQVMQVYQAKGKLNGHPPSLLFSSSLHLVSPQTSNSLLPLTVAKQAELNAQNAKALSN
jgi:prefoldin alpha subunit|eukprot:Stramenopile-MAST_4_protein_677